MQFHVETAEAHFHSFEGAQKCINDLKRDIRILAICAYENLQRRKERLLDCWTVEITRAIPLEDGLWALPPDVAAIIMARYDQWEIPQEDLAQQDQKEPGEVVDFPARGAREEDENPQPEPETEG